MNTNINTTMNFDSTFKDPIDLTQKNEMLREISEIKSETTLFEFIDKYFPNWIVDKANGFHKDYLNFTNNWKNICSRLGTSMKSILLVKFIAFNKTDPYNEYMGIKTVTEILTRLGFCVRREQEFKKDANGYLILSEDCKNKMSEI